MKLIRFLKHELANEITSWVNQDIISTQQAESICKQYGIDYNNQSRHSYAHSALIALGYLFFGLAVITLIGANWENISRGFRMGSLISITVAINLLGLYQFRKDKIAASIRWIFLGSLLYGASIMLIAQIYHIDEHYPNGIFYWAIGILPAAILLNSRLLMALSIVLGLIWFFVESDLDFYPTLFPIFLIALTIQLIRGKQSNILFIMLITALGFWIQYSFAWFLSDKAEFNFGAENVILGVGLFVLFHGLSKWLSASKDSRYIDYGTLLGVWILRFSIITLLIFSFEESWRELINSKWENPETMIGISIALSLIAIFLSYKGSRQSISTVAYAILFISAAVTVLNVNERENAIIFQTIDNIILIASGIWLIITGIRHSLSHYFYLGIVTILATGLLRYFDLIGDYISSAIIFAIFSVILLVAAKYWKNYITANT
jgi:uncharacterized membrane protein